MFSRRPETAVGIVALLVAAIVATWNPNGVALVLACVLALSALRFLSLPGPVEDPGRRAGALLTVPFFASFFLLAAGVFTVGKLREGELALHCGTILFCEWVVLVAWESRRARRQLREALAESR